MISIEMTKLIGSGLLSGLVFLCAYILTGLGHYEFQAYREKRRQRAFDAAVDAHKRHLLALHEAMTQAFIHAEAERLCREVEDEF